MSNYGQNLLGDLPAAAQESILPLGNSQFETSQLANERVAQFLKDAVAEMPLNLQTDEIQRITHADEVLRNTLKKSFLDGFNNIGAQIQQNKARGLLGAGMPLELDNYGVHALQFLRENDYKVLKEGISYRVNSAADYETTAREISDLAEQAFKRFPQLYAAYSNGVNSADFLYQMLPTLVELKNSVDLFRNGQEEARLWETLASVLESRFQRSNALGAPGTRSQAVGAINRFANAFTGNAGANRLDYDRIADLRNKLRDLKDAFRTDTELAAVMPEYMLRTPDNKFSTSFTYPDASGARVEVNVGPEDPPAKVRAAIYAAVIETRVAKFRTTQSPKPQVSQIY